MLTRRFLSKNVLCLNKFFYNIQETRLGRKTLHQPCLMFSLFGMEMHSSSSAPGIFCPEKELHLRSGRLQFCSYRNVFTKSRKEGSLRVKDKIPSGYLLIYKTPMDNYVKYGQWCASFGIVCTVALSLNELYFFSASAVGGNLNSSLSYIEFISLYIGLASIVTFLHVFLSKFTVRMYHNPSNDTYVAVFFNALGFVSKVDFRKGQVKPVKTRWPLPWKRNLFSIDGKTVVLNEIHFRVPADYNALLDYDKDT